jgi:ribonuclease HI
VKLTAYVDGSYNSNSHTYGGGVVVLMAGLDKPLEHKVSGNDTNFARFRNVSGEIIAAIAAINIAKEVKCTELVIHYDYEGLEKWTLPQGHPKFWNAKNNLSKAYRHVVVDAMESIKIKFVKEDAHTGVFYNELADKLAKEACRG